jgi:hypothetical protein
MKVFSQSDVYGLAQGGISRYEKMPKAAQATLQNPAEAAAYVKPALRQTDVMHSPSLF